MEGKGKKEEDEIERKVLLLFVYNFSFLIMVGDVVGGLEDDIGGWGF